MQIDRDIPASAEHDVSYDCSTGRYFLSANTNFIALSIGTWYAATTNKTAPSASSSSWIPGCSGLKKEILFQRDVLECVLTLIEPEIPILGKSM